jgi:hypothetical protein
MPFHNPVPTGLDDRLARMESVLLAGHLPPHSSVPSHHHPSIPAASGMAGWPTHQTASVVVVAENPVNPSTASTSLVFSPQRVHATSPHRFQYAAQQSPNRLTATVPSNLFEELKSCLQKSQVYEQLEYNSHFVGNPTTSRAALQVQLLNIGRNIEKALNAACQSFPQEATNYKMRSYAKAHAKVVTLQLTIQTRINAHDRLLAAGEQPREQIDDSTEAPIHLMAKVRNTVQGWNEEDEDEDNTTGTAWTGTVPTGTELVNHTMVSTPGPLTQANEVEIIDVWTPNVVTQTQQTDPKVLADFARAPDQAGTAASQHSIGLVAASAIRQAAGHNQTAATIVQQCPAGAKGIATIQATAPATSESSAKPLASIFITDRKAAARPHTATANGKPSKPDRKAAARPHTATANGKPSKPPPTTTTTTKPSILPILLRVPLVPPFPHGYMSMPAHQFMTIVHIKKINLDTSTSWSCGSVDDTRQKRHKANIAHKFLMVIAGGPGGQHAILSQRSSITPLNDTFYEYSRLLTEHATRVQADACNELRKLFAHQNVVWGQKMPRNSTGLTITAIYSAIEKIKGTDKPVQFVQKLADANNNYGT